MTKRVARRGRRALMLVVVVAGVLVGLVGMHHLAVAPAPEVVPVSHMAEDPAAGTGHPAPSHDGGNHESGLLHLCLAVLTAVAVLIASVVEWRRSRPRPSVARVARVALPRLRTAPRAPPPTAPARLALLCVLRT